MRKVLHVLGTRGMGWTGGISATLRSLAESRLASHYSFRDVTLEEARAELVAWRPDLFIWHGATSWRSLPRLARLRRRCRGVVFEHHYSGCFERHQVPSPRRFHAMLRIGYGLMNRVVAVSAGQAGWMDRAALVGEGRRRVILSSRRLEPFLALPTARPGGPPLTLAAYGRLTAQKGFDTLIRAVRSLPSGSVQLLIGGEGPLEQELRTLASGDDAIRFLGRVDDVPALLARSDAVVIPSRWEPWGNVCLEARAAGLPVVVSAVDGLPEQAEGCGFTVPPDDQAALAAALGRLLALPPSERSALGARARQSAESAWEDYLTGWEALLQEFR